MKTTFIYVFTLWRLFRMKTRLLARTHGVTALFGIALVASTAAVACGDDDTGAGPTPTPTPVEAGTPTDSGPGTTDTGPATDAPTDTGPEEAKPLVLALSKDGHDRFFAVAYDAAGNLYASGVKTTTTDASENVVSIVAKLTPAGKLDTTFGTNGVAEIDLGPGTETTRGVIVQSTGKIVIAGAVLHEGTVAADRDVAVARFNANGQPDTNFGTQGVVRLDLSTPDVGGTVFDSQWGLALGPSDAIFVHAGQKSLTGADSDFAIVKLDANGTPDGNFGTNGVTTVDVGGGRDASARGLIVLADGSVVAGGYMRDGTASTDPIKPVVIKLLPNGQPDPNFGAAGVYNDLVLPLMTEVYAVGRQGTSFVTAGYGRANETESLDYLSLRILANGTRDMTYGTNGVARVDLAGQADNARNVLVLPDNRVMIVGGGRTSATEQHGMVAILTPDGQPDTTFAPGGKKGIDLGGPADHFWGAAVSPDGKKVAIGGLTGGKDGGNDDAVIYVMEISK